MTAISRALRKALPYNPSVKCGWHGNGQPAATCSRCYDEALAQRDRQWAHERKAAHQQYLVARAAV